MASIESAHPFFILGAMKCGTSTLYRYLEQHPDVLLSHPKEPIFFEAQFERGLDFYRRRYFRHWSGQPIAGEARTHNLFLPYVPERIWRTFPDARLVAILRNPVDRAYSEWWHQYSRGLETLSFRDAVEVDRERIESGVTFGGEDGERMWRRGLLTGRDARTQYGLYLQLGHYAKQLERYLALFPRQQLLVLFFEDLQDDPELVVRETWEFLGADPSIALQRLSPQNVARSHIRSPWAARLNLIRVPHWLPRVLPHAIKAPIGHYLKGKPEQRPPMDPKVRQWLNAYFEPHNRALEELLGGRTRCWRTVPGTGDNVPTPS